MPTREEVTSELTRKICQDHPGWRAEKRCLYVNGEGITFIELAIRDSEQGQVLRAVYHHETGHVKKFY